MAIQIYKEPGFAEEVGGGLGQLLGLGLGAGAGYGIQQLQKGKLAKQYSQLFGVSPQQGDAIAALPPQAQQAYVKELMQAPSRTAYAQALGLASGTPGVPDTGLGQLPAGLTERQATELTKIRMKQQQLKEQSELKRQERADLSAKPYLTNLQANVPIAQSIKDIGSRMKQLLDTGNVRTGLVGGAAQYLPASFFNDETQQMISLSNELAGLIAASGKGVPTNFKIKLAQISKPHIGQSAETMKSLLDNLIKKADPVLRQDKARLAILEENQGRIPENLENLVKKKAHGFKKEAEKPKKIETLPDAKMYQGKRIRDTQTGQVLVSNGNDWIPEA